ncbi:phosphate ABC transporter permease PstA [Phenylobacterium sp. J426]|uniref:phosphate ABC transporter permease PstA n=1 Tax=Phenylobacterium sp. J426 TaxID=2898439 RepID=UPI00215106D8|nr:phosphate ABC transporter permease PstA [Phenylobacterium sp. J426]MCR5873374.1 phosphate ABC transporter permease PstA [Phenylobacterium sp. J426]
MTDAALPPAGAQPALQRSAIEARLKARRAREARFRWYGRLAITAALLFLAVLLGRIVSQGYTTFVDYRMSVPVYLDPARIDPTDPTGANYDLMVADAVLAKLGETDDALGTTSGKLMALLSTDLGFQLLDKVRADPRLIGQTVTVTGPVRADASLYFKGLVDASAAETDRKLDDRQIAWLEKLRSLGMVSSGFNTSFLTRSDSTEPEQAGVLGAVVGSALMLLVTGLLSVPIGVLAAVYLEEFAPKNRWTSIIEVNINNLAAVPSIVYGLLGLAVFINWLAVPRSSPLVGGLVLALMSLPTVIIATRSALKAVPPSIREAALGVGASRTQTVFHHVLPLAMPGVMTGAILSLAHALGETAPLLMVGMVSFVPGVPAGFTESATVLPVQVFIWENASERAFHERTAAAIMVLLVFMIVMNLAAILLRRRFERRW